MGLFGNSRELQYGTKQAVAKPQASPGNKGLGELLYGGGGKYAVINKKPFGLNWELEVWWLFIG